MLTGHGSHESALEAGRLHAFRYLLKPYEFDELASLIKEAAESKRTAQAAEFQEKQKEIVARGGTSREITEATEKLRREYELD